MNLAFAHQGAFADPQRAVGAAVQAPRTGKLEVSALELIEWAFQREKVGLDFDEIEQEAGASPGFGMEWILIEQARLGVKGRIQGGGSSPRHHDADMVAASLACLPETYGGRRMAVYIAELARSGERPDWLEGERPACAPVDWRGSKHGHHAVREVCRVPGLRWPADQVPGRDDGYWCPVTYTVDARMIAAARRRYLDWRGAIHHLQYIFQKACHLTSFTVSSSLPPRAPWKGA